MFYRVARSIVRFWLWLTRVKVVGAENLPGEGAVVVCGNHSSYWDPLVIGCLLPRPIHFMAKAEFFDNRLIAAVFHRLNAFPVRRGAGDRQAIRQAMTLLRAGEVVGIFPEGGRNQSGELLKPQLGAAMLALKTDSPVLPVACVGKQLKFIHCWFCPRELRVGALIPMAPYRGQKVNTNVLDTISTELIDKINELL